MTPVPFSKEHVATLKVGDQFETDGVIPGVAPDKLVWKVVAETRTKGLFLEARYRGVYFGSFTFAGGKLRQEKDS